MILYGAPMPAPNPRRVRMFLAEKGVDLPETRIDMMKREHKSPEYRAKNSMGQIPTLTASPSVPPHEGEGAPSLKRLFEIASRHSFRDGDDR